MLRIVQIIFAFFLIAVTACKKETDTASLSDTALNPSNVNANSFLASSTFDKLIVEVQYVNGSEPSAATITNVTSFLQSLLNKPAGITVTQKAVASPGKSAYTFADITTHESQNRTQLTKDKTLTAYVFFADGDYAETVNSNSKVLGIAYGKGSIAIFEKTIKSLSGGLTQPPSSVLETTVLEHEFGHVFGLVNNGTAMQAGHEDTPHGHHCTSSRCLMYYQAETSDIVANLTGGAVPSLDPNCNNDLKANGGK
ncbi:MAG TPA: hypothetical protein VG737_02670 [Cyclobacteriaceae bacterium]|nr:hypothetical protein [Cyclobacteriaceae bacterium]